MNLLDDIYNDMNEFIHQRLTIAQTQNSYQETLSKWPIVEHRDIVLSDEMGVELGNPSDESASFLVWTNHEAPQINGSITLIGPDIIDCKTRHLPFGKVIICRGVDFNQDNSYDRYREMDLLRFDMTLEGYMMRAVSQYLKEWTRLSQNVIQKKYSLFMLGKTFVEAYKDLPYIQEVNIVLVTSCSEDVRALKIIGENARRRVAALAKMTEELSFDCDACEYQDVCQEVSDLRVMRKKKNQ